MEAAKLEYQKDHELVNSLMSQGLIDVFGNPNIVVQNDIMTWKWNEIEEYSKVSNKKIHRLKKYHQRNSDLGLVPVRLSSSSTLTDVK